jgi:hypothetical protein
MQFRFLPVPILTVSLKNDTLKEENCLIWGTSGNFVWNLGESGSVNCILQGIWVQKSGRYYQGTGFLWHPDSTHSTLFGNKYLLSHIFSEKKY